MLRSALTALMGLATAFAALAQAPIPARPDDVPYRFIAEVAAYDGATMDSGARFQATLLVTPDRAAGERVTVLTATDTADLSPVERAIEKLNSDQLADAFWCSVPATDVAGALLVSEDAALAVYELPQHADTLSAKAGTSDKEGAAGKAAKYLRGTLTIDRTSGAVIARDSHLSRSFKPNVASRVRAIDGHRDCQLAPNGASYATFSSQYVKASAVGVLGIDRLTTITIRELIPLHRNGVMGETMTDVTP